MKRPRGLQFKVGILFVVTTIIILVINNFLIYWNTRLEMEKQLGTSLEAIAAAAAAQVDEPLLLHLLEQGGESRTYHNMQVRLSELARSTGVKRIYLFNSILENLVDSGDEFGSGIILPQLKFEQNEMADVFKGISSSTTLFRGNDGVLYKSGFAPISYGNQVIAAVGVDASASFLEVIQNLSRTMLLLGLICIAGVIMAAAVFSRTLVRPLRALVTSARQIGKGRFHHAVTVAGSDEIGFLGQTMDEMRLNILQRDQQLKMMIASIAHEIRNPLGGIELFAELIQSSLAKKDERWEQIQKILNETRKLKMTINHFLEYAKPSAPEKKPCSVQEIIEEVRPFVEKDLQQNNTILNYTSSNQDKKVICDERHLAQVFLNLIQNAIHAMPEGGIITISEMWHNDSLILRVADAGKGIPVELKEKIFDPFVTTKEKGTGLGLAIVKKLVEENGGEIVIEETNQKGTTFQITLPGNK